MGAVDLAGMQLHVQNGDGFSDEIADAAGRVVATMNGFDSRAGALSRAFAGMPRLVKASQHVLELLATDPNHNEGRTVAELYAALNAIGEVVSP